MTESEWWAATDPRRSVEWLFAQRPVIARKSRLFAYVCCRLMTRVTDWSRAKYLGIAEEFIEGKIDQAALLDQIDVFDAYAIGLPSPLLHALMRPSLLEHAALDHLLRLSCSEASGNPTGRIVADPELLSRALFLAQVGESPPQPHLEQLDCVHLLHDIFGPLPFRDVPIAPAWLTSDVTALARGIYDEKAFDRMPILADALQDAGCDNDEMLNHCRAANWEHVRGCWVLDLILGRPWREECGSA